MLLKDLYVADIKKTSIYFLLFVLSIGFVFADAEEFAEAKKLIDAKTPCSKLTEERSKKV